MAFNQTNTAHKTAFSIAMHSRKTDAIVSWNNLADSTVVKLFEGKRSVKELTADEVAEKFGDYFDNKNIYAVFIDTTAERPVISLEEF